MRRWPASTDVGGSHRIDRFQAELEERLARELHLGAQGQPPIGLEPGHAPEVEGLAKGDGVGVAAAAPEARSAHETVVNKDGQVRHAWSAGENLGQAFLHLAATLAQRLAGLISPFTGVTNAEGEWLSGDELGPTIPGRIMAPPIGLKMAAMSLAAVPKDLFDAALHGIAALFDGEN